jgi:tetratricopeptide (TPR) repeat protein
MYHNDRRPTGHAMTRASLTVITLLAAGAASVALAELLDVPGWWGLPAVPVTWYLLTWAGRASHRAWVRWNLSREAKSGAGPFVRAIEVWACVPKVSAGEAWFTAATTPTADLERAVLFPDSIGSEEDAVLADLNAATAASRRALVAGLRDLEDLAVAALRSPFHPLYPEADGILALVGHAPPRVFAHVRAAAAWRQRRPNVDPDFAEEAIAVRLLVGGLPVAALAALGHAGDTPRARQLRRLARFLALMRRGEALRAEEYASWAPELLLLAGRGIADLVPGSALLDAVPGGAAELERVLRRTPETVGDLSQLARDVPDVAHHVHQVLTRVLTHCRDLEMREFLAEGTPDRALTMHLRGLALVAEGRPREAVGEFEAALAHAPNFPAAAYCLALSRRRLGEHEAARDELRAYADRRTADPDAQLVLARYLAEEGREDDARGVYETTLRRFPRSLAIRVNFAQALSSWGRETEAAAQVETAHGDHPLDPHLALWTGRVRVHGGRAKDAVRPLRLAADRLQGPARAEAMFWLVAAYREQGRHDKALPYAMRLVDRLGSGQEGMLDEVAEYLEERHEYVVARAAADRARRLRGDAWA